MRGYLCNHRGAGALAGALLVQEVDDRSTNQLLSGMPEIPYLDQEPLVVPRRVVAGTFTRKLDGTAVLWSPLRLPDGSVEVFPRTRGVPVLWNTPYRAWRDLVAEAAQGLEARITRAVRTQQATLVFELWGHRNRHTVSYEEPLVLSLHTVVRGRSVLPWRFVAQVGKVHRLPIVPVIRRISHPTVRQLEEVGQEIAEQMEWDNDPTTGQYLEEGVVLVVEGPSVGRLWKFKPPSMAEYHRLTRCKVRPVTVRHELWKLVEAGEEPSLETLLETMGYSYDEEEIGEARGEMEREFFSWLQERDHYGGGDWV